MILTAPGSKSMTQRALILGALSQTTCRVSRPLACDDSRYLTDLLRALGVSVEWQDGEVVIAPPRDLRAPVAPVFCGNAGTAIRFGACLSLLAAGTLHLDGDAHMRKRPIGPLGDALAASNVEVTYLGDPGCPPLLLRRRGPTPPQITVDSTLSSQYASGLMLVAPRLPGGLELDLGGDVVSKPYLVMTEAMMRAAGATLERLDARRLAIAPGAYRAERLEVEPDWSGAAFLLAAGFVTGRDVTVAGLLPPEQSLQGDAVFLHQLAALRAPEAAVHRFDLTDAPDLIAPLVAACLFADRPTLIRGAAHTRIKESDRVAVLARELGKLGAHLTVHDDGLDVEPLAAIPEGSFALDPDDDHRMAMAFGVVGLRVPGLSVTTPECVSKSFPSFWPTLARFRT